MNQYGATILQHWRTYAPKELATMSPEEQQRYFHDLGEQIAEEIDLRTTALEQVAETPAGGSYLAMLGQMNNARATAEAEVMREYLQVPQEDLGTA